MRWGFAALIVAAALAACQPTPPLPPPSPPPAAAGPPRYIEVGMASWYGPGFAKKRTADGERFEPNALTAAHRLLPLNSFARVTNLENGKSVVVRINDRGPYAPGRILDLSSRAARELGMKKDGVARVRIEEMPEAQANVM
ncbi:MAG TPA: septal ring lytic transglycosylase RlpA family protein [Stellaceae bacterium]|nr:septal ring lytic transglycosylase RlpA family protein [Stellaceae bacterium]